jgi:serine/threonine-protein kinase
MFCPRCHREYADDFRFCPIDGEATTAKPDLTRVASKPTQFSDELVSRRYRVRGFIGKGSYSRVYLAEDEKTGNPVAIKVMEKPFRDDAAARRRFLQESQAITKIGHPNIVRVLEAGIRASDHAPYLAMEFLFGEPVGTHLRRDGALALDIALPALRQAAAALSAAHALNIVHRDVKPDNLFFIGEPGDPYDLKVLDFGFSKLQTSHLTAAGIVLGTPAYMAPEQVLAEDVDARADIYGLGMVMYHMLTGRPPFSTGDDVKTLAKQLSSHPPAPSARLSTIDGRSEQVISMATQKNPENRYPTMQHFFDDLGRLAHPHVPLFAAPAGDASYEPRSKMGQLVKEALTRNIRRDDPDD